MELFVEPVSLWFCLWVEAHSLASWQEKLIPKSGDGGSTWTVGMFLGLVLLHLSSHIPTALIEGRPVLEITYTQRGVQVWFVY